MRTVSNHRPNLTLFVLSVCLLLLGLNGFIGGYLMLVDPNGAPMGMPVSQLENTLFQDFSIPGLLLIGLWGVGSLITLIGLWARRPAPVVTALTAWTHEHWAWVFSVVMGAGLLVWLTYQVFTLPQIAPIQILLYGLAAMLIVLPFVPAMRRYYHLVR